MYTEYEIEVDRQSNGDGLATGNESTTISFFPGDQWALVEPSDGVIPSDHPLPGAPSSPHSGAYWVPVNYNTTVYQH